MASDNALSIYAGEHKTLRVVVTDRDGEPVNITGATLLLTVRLKPDSEDLVFERAGTIADGPAGLGQVLIQPADTQNLEAQCYSYDLWIDNLLPDNTRHILVPPSRFEVRDPVRAWPVP